MIKRTLKILLVLALLINARAWSEDTGQERNKDPATVDDIEDVLVLGNDKEPIQDETMLTVLSDGMIMVFAEEAEILKEDILQEEALPNQESEIHDQTMPQENTDSEIDMKVLDGTEESSEGQENESAEEPEPDPFAESETIDEWDSPLMKKNFPAENHENDSAEKTKAEYKSKAILEIADLKVTPVETNDRYSTLTFAFSSHRQEYTCLVTGLREIGENPQEAYERLAQVIAERFLAGEPFTLSDQTAAVLYGLDLDLIDAEKVNRYTGEDKNICWAASAADMLEYAGWNVQEGEDEAFQVFREEFSNLGGYQTSGISWYLNGVNPEQYIYESSGNVAYHQDLDHGAAQQQNEGTGGYWPDYAAAEVATETGYYDQVSEQLDAAADLLEEGYSVGIGAYFYREDQTLASGHAMTVFGYVRQWLDHATSALHALFISDSDDRATGETVLPEIRPNEYVMYHVSPYEEGNISGVQMEDYSSSLTTVIGMVSTLMPRENASEETEGTKDPVSSPNLIPVNLLITDETGIALSNTEPGARVAIQTEFENRAYQKLPEGSEVRYRVSVYRDGVLMEEIEQATLVSELRPNRSAEASLDLTLTEVGEYTFETEILRITDAEGNPVSEAYLNDNLYRGSQRKVIVKDKEPEKTEQEQEKETDTVNSSLEDEAAVVRLDWTENNGVASDENKAERIYRLTVILATDTEYVLPFEAPVASADYFLTLRNRITGEIVDPDFYVISTSEEGAGYIISFKDQLIQSLHPGNNDFALIWETGCTLIRITVI